MPKSPTPSRGWKPRETFFRDGHRGPPPHVQEHLKTCAAANKERLQGQHAEEVKESQEKYDRGGNNSYPRTGRDHNKWCEKKHRGRHISLTAGDDIGRVRGETHDADTDFEARTHASLDKRALRRNQGGTHRRPTDNSGRKRGRDGFYSKDREVPVNVSVERSRVDEPVNAGPVTTASSSLAESTPSSMAESTPSSMADPTPVAESAPAASSSVVDPMPVTESAAEAPSSLAEPTSLPSPGDEAGPTSACEEDDDWVIVEYNDFPTLPTYPGGAIDFTRLELEHFHLVPVQEWMYGNVLWEYYGLLGDGNDVAHETNSIARCSLLTRFLNRQLKADRILLMLDYDFDTLRRTAELEWVYLSSEEARARG
ncbi:hypothetical protein THAOC_08413 [Thalassiosira oceanica]|uniref:Uncharacterized protein n=1 Tax=Thalassiosira oceanica TaxID=159749 RepID=K0SZ43_THAOC|nr:hypothetical protein THAOC_08413 [Thalassiosira oceanica]|eukprot:EJK70244.1 hypothetical protein THAOC_08413 [Thalassiosira oceanica]